MNYEWGHQMIHASRSGQITISFQFFCIGHLYDVVTCHSFKKKCWLRVSRTRKRHMKIALR